MILRGFLPANGIFLALVAIYEFFYAFVYGPVIIFGVVLPFFFPLLIGLIAVYLSYTSFKLYRLAGYEPVREVKKEVTVIKKEVKKDLKDVLKNQIMNGE